MFRKAFKQDCSQIRKSISSGSSLNLAKDPEGEASLEFGSSLSAESGKFGKWERGAARIALEIGNLKSETSEIIQRIQRE